MSDEVGRHPPRPDADLMIGLSDGKAIYPSFKPLIAGLSIRPETFGGI